MLSLLATLSLCSFPLRPQADEAGRLLPADATVLVRIESTRAWNEFVRAFAPLGGEETAKHDLQAVLDEMADADVAPEDRPQVDPDGAMYLALSFDPAAGAAFTFVAPVTNGRAFRLHPTFTSGRQQTAQLGNLVGVSTTPGYAVSAAPSPLVGSLRPGLISVHVDLAKIIAAFRPLVDMGLHQAETAMDDVANEDMAFDLEPLMEAYLSGARTVIDSAESLDLTLTREGDEVGMRFDYTERGERVALQQVTDVTPLLGYLDPASSAQMAFSGKWPQYVGLFEEFVEAVLEVYPEPLRSDMARMLDMQHEIEPLLAPGMVLGFDFGPQGMHASYVMRSDRPAELMAKLEEMIRSLDREDGFVRIGEAEPLALPNIQGRSWPFVIQYESLAQMIKDMADAQDQLPHEAEHQFMESMRSIYGRDMRMAIAHKGALVAVCFGGGRLRAEHRPRAPERARSARTEAARALVENLEPGALGFVYSPRLRSDGFPDARCDARTFFPRRSSSPAVRPRWSSGARSAAAGGPVVWG